MNKTVFVINVYHLTHSCLPHDNIFPLISTARFNGSRRQLWRCCGTNGHCHRSPIGPGLHHVIHYMYL